jgi:hypothetical protein
MGDRKINQGIQANTVNADVIAVGTGARAIKYSNSSEYELREAVDELRDAIASLNLRPGVKARIGEDLGALKQVAEKKLPDDTNRGALTLYSVAGQLKSAGVVLPEVVTLADPVRKIAGLLRVPLDMLGLKG